LKYNAIPQLNKLYQHQYIYGYYMTKKKNASAKAATESLPALSGTDSMNELNISSTATEETASLNSTKQREPYRVIFVSAVKGFELGEHYAFRQRVFRFKEKPEVEVITALKEAGFIYRPHERAWTIPADYASRRISDTLARRFADKEISVSM